MFNCPACKKPLKKTSNTLSCPNKSCGKKYPIVNNVPILINESKSLFLIQDFIQNKSTTRDLKKNILKEAIKKIVPKIGANIHSRENYKLLVELLKSTEKRKRVLVVGGSILGNGMEALVNEKSFEIIETDVSFGPRTSVICDGHDLPFQNGSFDCVIIQAVLEHVIDPYRCVEEIFRVLKKDGLVYAETPFMQQVHNGKYDFTRFTHLGHRRLFRRFSEIKSCVVGGPGMALAWAYQYFLVSFFTSRLLRYLLITFARFTSFPLKYFDYYLADRPGGYDAASGFCFMGRKSSKVLNDKELLKSYKGLISF